MATNEGTDGRAKGTLGRDAVLYAEQSVESRRGTEEGKVENV